jgi:NAD(P)H dehydrogenase (quinone)
VSTSDLILVTGAAGRIGGVGRGVVELLRQRDLPVRAMVRTDDQRADVLRAIGAEVLVGDLTQPGDVAQALKGVRRMFFGMSVSASYLEATAIAAAAARERAALEVFVNISQLTVSQMSLTNMTASPQHRQHWLAEQLLDWSGLPVVHVRPTVFLQHPFFLDWAAQSIARDGVIRLPFGAGRTSPVDTRDVAEVIATILANPEGHVGKIYELTGPKSLDITSLAAEYEAALCRPVQYDDVPLGKWEDELRGLGLPQHLLHHLLTMAELHAANRYDRLAHDVEKVIGRPAKRVRDFVAQHADSFQKKSPAGVRNGTGIASS